MSTPHLLWQWVRGPLWLGLWVVPLSACATSRPAVELSSVPVVPLRSDHVEADGSRAMSLEEHQRAVQMHRTNVQHSSDLAHLYRSLAEDCKSGVRRGKHAHAHSLPCRKHNEALYRQYRDEAVREEGFARAHEQQDWAPPDTSVRPRAAIDLCNAGDGDAYRFTAVTSGMRCDTSPHMMCVL